MEGRCVPSPPNEAAITANVLSLKPTDDGWGAWAEIKIITVKEIPGQKNFAVGLSGRKMKVFVSPQLLNKVVVGNPYAGRLTFRGGSTKSMWCLLP